MERARALATAQGRTKATFADISAFYREGPRRAAPGTATSTSNKASPTHLLSPAEMARREWLRQHFRAQIGMRAMQIMLDMMMDLMNKIAWVAAMILEKDGRRTLTVHDIATAASLILCDGKDAHSCSIMLEMNIKAYANYLYNKWWDCVCKERAAVRMAAAQLPPPPYPILEKKSKTTRPSVT
jgi:hypothetical protein